MRNLVSALPVVCLLLASCGDDLQPKDGKELPEGDRVVHLGTANGVTTTRIDASMEEGWVYLDLDQGREVADSSPDWDLAFQRFAVISNGGASGDGGVSVATLTADAFDSLQSPPADGWVEDAADGDDRDEYADSAFLFPEAWYAYHTETHGLAAAPFSYVIETTEGAFFKLRFLGYYDDAGTGGFPAFQWSQLVDEQG